MPCVARCSQLVDDIGKLDLEVRPTTETRRFEDWIPITLHEDRFSAYRSRCASCSALRLLKSRMHLSFEVFVSLFLCAPSYNHSFSSASFRFSSVAYALFTFSFDSQYLLRSWHILI